MLGIFRKVELKKCGSILYKIEKLILKNTGQMVVIQNVLLLKLEKYIIITEIILRSSQVRAKDYMNQNGGPYL